MADNVDLESLVHLEQTFYDAGYTDGVAHGRIHGLIQGRALGRTKGFEIWEELGFYEGFGRTWRAAAALDGHRDQSQRALHHITHLLDLIRQFPTVNPSSSLDTDLSDEIDMSKLLRQIRSRYKALCASLGVRPSLRAGPGPGASDDTGDERERGQAQAQGRLPLANLDAPHTKRPVWLLDSDVRRPTAQGLSF